ncbi:gamma-glutamylcyclotransferase [Marinimicrococcus flavescens]|uniref:glutathione-specific gamma-glutamylcyclotransferase n=1 Tax=Marinimicrococcus flavescens TaxID=3031815 RepID=A0AAP3XQ58_9PROT|nr:gamma-glutamylcyclotransferase [Marinimicrococcus flavescens]
MVLTREKIKQGWIQELVAQVDGPVKPLTLDELRASREAILAELPPGEDVWVFGYGSLIWNPCIEFAEKRIARVVGYHRRFCLWTHSGRGTRDNPGLMLGLEAGGSCRGVAFRVPHEAIESELDIVWRREMVMASYRPVWVRLATTGGRLRAIAFVINRSHERYAGKLGDERIVEALASACGPLGSCADYLFNTVAHLDELGIHDPGMHRLCAAVRRQQAALQA